MKNGVLFKGKPWYDETGKEHSYCLVCGELVRDAEEYCHTKPRVKFCVRYHRKTFLNCIVDDCSPFFTVASQLREGEYVTVIGKYSKSQYETKKGERKDEFYLSVGFIIPQSLVTGGYSSENVSKDDSPDPMESFDNLDF